MSDTPPTAPKAKPVDLPDTGLEDDADPVQGLKTVENESASTNSLVLFENTSITSDDTSALEVYERNMALFNESIVDRPLIDDVDPISQLRDEYENPAFIEQINWLEIHGYHSIRRTRGDGDCFYRSFGFAFVERLFHAADTRVAVRRAIEILDKARGMLSQLFDSISYEESYDAFKELIQDIEGGQGHKFTTQESLVETFQDLYHSNAIVSYLRSTTAAQIQLAPSDYEAFLTNQDIPDSGENLDPQAFSARFVMPLGKEADDVQISALCRAFQMNVDILYVDGREYNNRNTAEKVRLVPFRFDIDKDATPISLLYRPGHYDILVGKYHE